MKLAGELDDFPDVPVFAVAAVCPTIDLERCVQRDRAPPEHSVPVQLRPQSPRPHAAEGRALARGLRPQPARSHLDDSSIRRCLHGAASWLRRRGQLLRACKRTSRGTPHSRPDAHPRGGGRPVRSAGSVLAIPPLADNPHVLVVVSPHGGHCGFISEPSPGDDGYWAETAAMTFFERVRPR